MSDLGELRFQPDKEGKILLPERCSIAASFYEAPEVRQAVIDEIHHILSALALSGLDLRALDGITFTGDCGAAATALQCTPEGLIPLEMSERPDTTELARTTAVWRDNELRFHIVCRAGLGLMALSPETSQQALAHACIAHEAAHVEHEGHLYRTFPYLHGGPLECGERSRQTFIKAIDAWSEYAASRSSAVFRPEAVYEFEDMFCRALKESFTSSTEQIAYYRQNGNAKEVFVGLQQLFGDVFIRAGYFLGHLDGLELKLDTDAPRLKKLFNEYPQIHPFVVRLRRVLHELWLSEFGWNSIEVFAPIYELLVDMMALHGLVFAKHGDEWKMVLCEEKGEMDTIRDALTAYIARSDKAKN